MNRTAGIILILALIICSLLTYKAIDYRLGANQWLDKYTAAIPELARQSHFARANGSLPRPDPATPRLVAFGTQVISRWDLSSDLDNYEVINRGIDGQWAAGLVLRFQSDVVALNPAVVLIEISSYNLRPQYKLSDIQAYLQSMVDMARANSIRPVITSMIGNRSDAGDCDNCENYSVTDSIRTYNQWLQRYAEENDINVIDFNRLLSGTDGYLSNQLSSGPIDPNDEGYLLMSGAVRDLLLPLDIPSTDGEPR